MERFDKMTTVVKFCAHTFGILYNFNFFCSKIEFWQKLAMWPRGLEFERENVNKRRSLKMILTFIAPCQQLQPTKLTYYALIVKDVKFIILEVLTMYQLKQRRSWVAWSTSASRQPIMSLVRCFGRGRNRGRRGQWEKEKTWGDPWGGRALKWRRVIWIERRGGGVGEEQREHDWWRLELTEKEKYCWNRVKMRWKGSQKQKRTKL